jgi:hypothetical protein
MVMMEDSIKFVGMALAQQQQKREQIEAAPGEPHAMGPVPNTAIGGAAGGFHRM